jgi:hypothetical protein
MNYTDEAWEEEQMNNLGCESVADLIGELKQFRKENKLLRKKNAELYDVLTTLDEMIRNRESHVELMKAFEQGLGLIETWKEMIE